MTFTRVLSSKSSFQKYSEVLDYVNESREFQRRVKEELTQHFYECVYMRPYPSFVESFWLIILYLNLWILLEKLLHFIVQMGI